MFNHINRDIVKWKVRSLSWHFKIKTITQTPCYFSPCSTMEENLTSIVHVFQDNLKFSIPQWNKKFMILRCLVLPLYCWNISWSKRADHFYPPFFFFFTIQHTNIDEISTMYKQNQQNTNFHENKDQETKSQKTKAPVLHGTVPLYKPLFKLSILHIQYFQDNSLLITRVYLFDNFFQSIFYLLIPQAVDQWI